MTKRVTVEQAQAELPQLLAEAVEGGERIIIERPGKLAAVLVGAADLPEEQEPRFQPNDWLTPLIGAWGDILTDEEIDQFIADIYADRERDYGRPVNLELDDE